MIVSNFLGFLGFTRSARTILVFNFIRYRILQVGLLPVCNHQQVPFAYKMYTTDDETGWKQSTAFKRAFSINVEIEFVGVWSVFDLSHHINNPCADCANIVRDTVDSVGLIPRRLPFTQVDNNIRYFRHALSLDEHRAWVDISFVILKIKGPHCCKLVVSNPVHGTAQHTMITK